MPYFIIDHLSLKIDTPDGKNQLHGTVIIAYQNKTNKKEESYLVIVRNSRREHKLSKAQFIKLFTINLQTVQTSGVY